MKKAHAQYLRRAVNMSINFNGVSDVKSLVNALKSPGPKVYQMIRDICGDFRFFSVTENTQFWHRYAFASVALFLDSIDESTWRNPEKLERRREDFLFQWYFAALIPVDDERIEELENTLREHGWVIPRIQAKKKVEIAFDPELDCHVSDYTDGENAQLDNSALPAEIQDYNKGMPFFGGGEEATHNAEAEYLHSIDKDLVKLAKMIGRKPDKDTMVEKGKFQRSSRSDISGITVGDDLNSLLPSELAMFAMPATENLFYQRYTQKRLQVFSSNSHSTITSKEKSGPIFMCIDTSGSMSGEPEKMAKSLALTIAIIAQRQHRPLCIINYSWDISFIILTNLQRQKRAFMSFLSMSYGGGNNENMLFNFLFDKLPRHPKFTRHTNKFDGADLLVVSDFQWGALDEKVKLAIQSAHDGGMKLYALGIDFHDYLTSEDHDKHDENLRTGLYFFNTCDHKFIYSGNHCRDVTNNNKMTKHKHKQNAKNETSRRDGADSRVEWEGYDNGAFSRSYKSAETSHTRRWTTGIE